MLFLILFGLASAYFAYMARFYYFEAKERPKFGGINTGLMILSAIFSLALFLFGVGLWLLF